MSGWTQRGRRYNSHSHSSTVLLLRRRLLFALVAVVLIIFSGRTFLRNPDWVSEEELYRTGLEVWHSLSISRCLSVSSLNLWVVQIHVSLFFLSLFLIESSCLYMSRCVVALRTYLPVPSPRFSQSVCTAQLQQETGNGNETGKLMFVYHVADRIDDGGCDVNCRMFAVRKRRLRCGTGQGNRAVKSVSQLTLCRCLLACFLAALLCLDC